MFNNNNGQFQNQQKTFGDLSNNNFDSPVDKQMANIFS